MDSTDISQPSSVVQSFAIEWQRNRDVLAGARAIRLYSTRYLPQQPGQDLLGYNSFLNRVRFFPAASRTHDGLVGLLFRKAPTITAPADALPLLATVTDRGWNLEKLARWVASELLAVAWGGLLVDLPVAPAGLDLATERAGNYRPFIAPYVAEAVLTVTPGVVNNRTVLTRVVLKDDAETIRELLLVDGIYTVVMHRSTKGAWIADAPVQPRFAGKTLSEIPFTPISLDDFQPVTAPMSDICDHNVRHYLACANVAACHYFSSSPIYNVMGTEAGPEQFPVYPGAMWTFKTNEVTTKILEYNGTVIGALRQEAEDIRDEMAAIGLRILAADKASVESADALAIRRAAENATIASLSRVANAIINLALDHFAMALGLSPDLFKIEINNDFNALPLSNLDVQARVQAWQAGAFSLASLQAMFVDGEVLPENFDPAVDAQARAEEIADAPTRELPRPGDMPGSEPGAVTS